jgi:hypothetical protein
LRRIARTRPRSALRTVRPSVGIFHHVGDRRVAAGRARGAGGDRGDRCSA